MTGIQKVAAKILKIHRHQADAVYSKIAERQVRETLELFQQEGYGAYRISSLLTEEDKPRPEAA